MRTQFSLFRAVLSLTVLTAPVFAHGQSSQPGYLDDHHYQVANLSSYSEAQALMDTETRNTSQNSICSSRADLWSFIMNKEKNVQVGKVFIHYTDKSAAEEDSSWSYHVAPYVLVNGEEVVMDNGFYVFNHKPVPLSDWTQHFSKTRNCVVLDPVHNKDHLGYEQNNLPFPWSTPLNYKKGGARKYPSTEGICYLRKVPMYYESPKDIYAADLGLSGQADYRKFINTGFNKKDVMDSCKQALTYKHQVFQESCSKYLGFEI